MRRGLVASPGPAALLGSGAASDAATADPLVPTELTCSHRSDHSSACDVSTLPLTAGWPPALRARNRRLLPAPSGRVSPPRPPHAPHSTLQRILQRPAASSASVLPPAFLPPDPKCSNGSIGRPDR